MLDASSVKVIPNVLTREQCAEIIANAKDFEYDYLKRDIAPQSKFYDKETLDKNTIERSIEESFEMYGKKIRKVAQSPIEDPIFPEWDGKPVYRCKVMRYNEGEYVGEHYDAQWMCMSNYWKPDTNMESSSLISIALNDDYEGGEFTVEGEVVPQEVGSAIQIPQHPIDKSRSAKHGVNEVKKGTRYALVFWNFE